MPNGQTIIEQLQRSIRKMRLFILLLIFLVLALSLGNIYQYVVFSRHHASEVTMSIEKYPLIDPSRHLVKQEHFLSTIQPLRAYLKDLVENEKSADISIYYEFLNTGANISINPDTRYYPASLIKLPIAIVAIKNVQDGKWQLDSELVLMKEDINEEFGDMYTHYDIGDRITVAEVIKWSLIKSDNTAHDILFRNTTTEERVAYIDAVGLYELFDENFSVTAKEYSRVLRSLYTASYLNREYSQMILDWLSQAEFKDFLSSGVEASTSFSHKYGIHTSNNIFSDAGIVYYPNRPYLLTVMIKGKLENHVENKDLVKSLMQNISAKAYETASN